MRKNKRKNVSEILDIPSGILGGFVLEVYSANEAVLTGKAEVLKLEDTLLKLKCGDKEISFGGNNINIIYYTSDGIKIDGNISSIEMK